MIRGNVRCREFEIIKSLAGAIPVPVCRWENEMLQWRAELEQWRHLSESTAFDRS